MNGNSARWLLIERGAVATCAGIALGLGGAPEALPLSDQVSGVAALPLAEASAATLSGGEAGGTAVVVAITDGEVGEAGFCSTTGAAETGWALVAAGV